MDAVWTDIGYILDVDDDFEHRNVGFKALGEMGYEIYFVGGPMNGTCISDHSMYNEKMFA